jgi:hypothetical protein
MVVENLPNYLRPYNNIWCAKKGRSIRRSLIGSGNTKVTKDDFNER